MKLLYLLVTIPSLIYSLDSSYIQGKNTTQLEDKKLQEYEAQLDKQIHNLNKKISEYILLVDLDITEYPARVNITKSTGYFTVSTFLETEIHHKLHQMKTKRINIYYEGKKFTKSEIFISETSYKEAYNYNDILIDTDPAKLNRDSIEIVSKLIDRNSSIKLGDMENNIVLQNRILFKKDFYIPTLQFFTNALQVTREYHFRKEVKKENHIINNFIKSKRY